jgi:hypothetical protein
MLAYVFWHWTRDGIDAAAYEAALQRFYESLCDAPSAGLVSVSCDALRGAPWARDAADAYEDWYVVGSSADLDPLNDAAVSAARQAPHDAAAAIAGGGTAGLYRLRLGSAAVGAAHTAWFSKPAGWTYARLYDELQPIVDRAGAALWGRQMTLGPAREFCLHSTAPVALPPGIDAVSPTRRAVFRQGA